MVLIYYKSVSKISFLSVKKYIKVFLSDTMEYFSMLKAIVFPYRALLNKE